MKLTPFYPEIAANNENMIAVGNDHEIYVASYGNPQGIPVVMLHGGPGAGSSPYFAQFFDPERYHIIVTDQRGSGKSRPKGEMAHNTTSLLIDDLERIRNTFGIDKWVVFGGSWGSTLALLYAEAHPERVLALLLRGIFLVGKDDIDAFTRDDSPAALLHGREWSEFKRTLAELVASAGLQDVVAGLSVYETVYELLQCPNQLIREDASATLSAWEKFNSYLIPNQEDVDWARTPDGINMALTEATYFKHGCFIEPNQIMTNLHRLAGIPVHMVQGLYDLVCPAYMADQLENGLLAINQGRTDLITRDNPLAGHSQMEPAIASCLINAGNRLADRLK